MCLGDWLDAAGVSGIVADSWQPMAQAQHDAREATSTLRLPAGKRDAWIK
jgi:hypothetical protein